MIRFSQRLQDVLATTRWTQKDLARHACVSATNVSRWLSCKALPDRNALGKVIEILPEELAPPLIAAWVLDALPANADQMVTIISNSPSSKFKESPPDDWPPELNTMTRRKFIDFSKLASKNTDVMEIVDVLHAAAMRATSAEKAEKKAE